MNEAEIKQFRHKLLSLRTELQKLEDSSKEATKPVELDQAALGRLSRMDALQAELMAQEPARRRQRNSGKSRVRFAVLKQASTAAALYAAEETDIHRLSADPTNTRCIKCVESQHRQAPPDNLFTGDSPERICGPRVSS